MSIFCKTSCKCLGTDKAICSGSHIHTGLFCSVLKGGHSYFSANQMTLFYHELLHCNIVLMEIKTLKEKPSLSVLLGKTSLEMGLIMAIALALCRTGHDLWLIPFFFLPMWLEKIKIVASEHLIPLSCQNEHIWW